MKSTRRAVVDVGTNSVKLLVAEVAGREAWPICEESLQTRLGEGFYPGHVLQAAPIAETAKAVAAFVVKAGALGAGVPRIVATSAAREATNQLELTAAIAKASGIPAEIISGEEEARYAFLGVTSDPRLAGKPLLLLDVGGGSTEFILAQKGQKEFAYSFALGTVRLLERLPLADPPRPEQLASCRSYLKRFLEGEIIPRLEGAAQESTGSTSLSKTLELIATGGTASGLHGSQP
jgi:exopolyphosphatase/guanosine-5'-triphosphate,3'-diphosphate pyrophosphatase